MNWNILWLISKTRICDGDLLKIEKLIHIETNDNSRRWSMQSDVHRLVPYIVHVCPMQILKSIRVSRQEGGPFGVGEWKWERKRLQCALDENGCVVRCLNHFQRTRRYASVHYEGINGVEKERDRENHPPNCDNIIRIIQSRNFSAYLCLFFL